MPDVRNYIESVKNVDALEVAEHSSHLTNDDDSHGQAQSFYILNQFNSKCANMFSSHNVCKRFSSVHFNCRILHKKFRQYAMYS